MKEKIYLDKKEQIDLISDPLTLSIIGVMGDNPLTKKEVAEELDEDLTMVNRYIKEMTTHGLIEVVNQGEEPAKYQQVAKAIHTDRDMLKDGNYYWASGILNHIENELIDVLKITNNTGEELSKEIGYEDPTLTNYNINMTKDEYHELVEMLKEFSEKMQENKETEGKRKYSVNLIAYPAVAGLKKVIKEEKE